MTTLEEVAKHWAAKKYDLPLEEIRKVSFDHYKGESGCPTCDYGGECEFQVSVNFTAQSKTKYKTFVEYSFSGILEELLNTELDEEMES